MDRQQDKQLAVDTLKRAGFEPLNDQNERVWTRAVGRSTGSAIDVCTLQDDGLFEFQQVGRFADMASVLGRSISEKAAG